MKCTECVVPTNFPMACVFELVSAARAIIAGTERPPLSDTLAHIGCVTLGVSTLVGGEMPFGGDGESNVVSGFDLEQLTDFVETECSSVAESPGVAMALDPVVLQAIMALIKMLLDRIFKA